MTSYIPTAIFGGTGVETLVKKFNDTRQKGSNPATGADQSPLETLINDVVRRAKDRLLSNQGNELQKADSLQELLFLHYQGVNIDWADFPISEIMMSENISVKMMAYLAASEFWTPNSDVVMMVISCINKDLLGADPFRKTLALTLIPLIATPQFAESVVTNVTLNFNNPRDDIRQKTITCFYKLCLKFPECLPPGIKAMNLKGILIDKTNPPGVIQAALTLLNELCMHNPSNYKVLLPTIVTFFQDYVGSPWILVRALNIVSTIGATLEITALEKFNQKISGMINEVLNSASSPSVVFEVIRLICTLRINNRELIRTAADRAQSFIENEDPNLRYLGLISITRLMQLNQSIINLHRQTLMNCLESDDQTCVFIAVDLLESIVTKKNIGEIVLNLVDQIEARKPGVVRDTLVSRLISICRYGKETSYERFTDYEWYVNILLTIHSFGVESSELSEELLTMALRAKSTRPVLVTEMIEYMKEMNVSETHFIEIAAFILGEYSEGDEQQISFDLLLGDKIEQVKPSAQSACLQNAFKIYAKSNEDSLLQKRSKSLKEKLPKYTQSRYTEVQEGASMMSALVDVFSAQPNAQAISSLYSAPLAAVDPQAQSKVKLPSGLDLTQPIVDLDPQDNSGFVLDDLEEDDPNAPNKSLFLLRSADKKKQTQAKTDKVVVLTGTLGVNLEPPKRQRRLMPILDDQSNSLLPVEGDQPKKSNAKTTQSPISQISFNINDPSTQQLPELKPYSQDELLAKQSKQLLQQRREILPSIQSDDVFRQIGNSQGIALTITDIQPRTNGIEISVQVLNTSSAPISAVEFTLDDTNTQCLRQEILPGDKVMHKIAYRTKPVLEPKIVKVTVIPTGGSGEMLRGKLRVVSTMFLQNADSEELDVILPECTKTEKLEFGDKVPVQQLVRGVSDATRGSVHKREIDGKKVVAIASKAQGDVFVVSLVIKEGSGFVVEVRTNDEKLTQSVISELKLAFKKQLSDEQ
ncbi:Adaptin N terminal region family protein [Trichomonas vaginalis G3]|uniref:Adaptin N terminal region family protein n=1 Tax=Trichomonas vaginalis (strain ATCC PRA-98 / G3) TaxID=412133 RepID=A2FT75_TRIV3|nr:delta adaptin-related family [Trichomonas vaginalis G3]EAX91886.1 Adaptin N terminal region family protein [Trichomonas vaginalis G3]KAI5518546.1 delta adaptin-related family [Trichomonas vaginalis G3]|eukprot:XP_001304816.1 Adaptin N terminal region family protein [Trichomonas vaginalis G3]